MRDFFGADSPESSTIDPVRLGWLILGGLLLITAIIIHNVHKKQIVHTKGLLREQERVKRLIEKYSYRKDYTKENSQLLDDLTELEKRQNNWWYLKYLEAVGVGNFKPRYSKIGFADYIRSKDFERVTREVAFSARYDEIVLLISQLEAIGGFEIQGLSIRESTTETGLHRVTFKLTSLEIKESVLKSLKEGLKKGIKKKPSPYQDLALLIQPVWKPVKKVQIKKVVRDPFVNIKRRREKWLEALKERLKKQKDRKEALEKVRIAREKRMLELKRRRAELERRRLEKERKLAMEKAIREGRKVVLPLPIDISLELEMVGFFDFQSGRIALLKPDNYIRVGDLVNGMKVTRIEPRKVVFKKGIQEYYTLMEILGIPIWKRTAGKKKIEIKRFNVRTKTNPNNSGIINKQSLSY